MLTRFKETVAEDRHGESRGETAVRMAGYPTPGEVFGEIGVTVAAFLAIALLANLLALALGT